MSHTPEIRNIKVHQNIIYHMIHAQCGSLGKALLEYIMNATDAKASRVDIKLDNKQFTVNDNGGGFKAIQDILECFEVLGFDHGDNNQRTYGKFGIGRAQGFAFARTTWRTSTFKMVVDVKNRGTDYELYDNLESVSGCEIIGDLYTELLPSEVVATVNELRLLAKYCPIDVYVNDQLISVDPKKQKWDIETDDAYITIKPTGELQVYNLGIHVRAYYASHIGCAGVVVSKHNLQLNTARNDVLVSQCEVWKRIVKYLRKKTEDTVKIKKTLSDTEREYLIRQFISGEKTYADIEQIPVIRDVRGKSWVISKLNSERKVSIAPNAGSVLADKVHEQKMAFVLHENTLAEFGCESLEDLTALLKRLSLQNGWPRIHMNPVPLSTFSHAFQEQYKTIDPKKLKKIEKYILQTLNKEQTRIGYIAKSYLLDENQRLFSYRGRELRIGESDIAEAWTDGATAITINRNMLKLAHKGYIGFVQLTHLILHEYCHDEADDTDHVHDIDFYKKYHDLTSSTKYGLYEIAQSMFRTYTTYLRRMGEKVNQKMLRQEDFDVHHDKALNLVSPETATESTGVAA